MKASVLAAAGLFLGACASGPGSAPLRGDILIDGKGVHPESVTSTAQGALFTGSVPGIIYRAGPGETVAKPFIMPSAENGLRSVYGVLADVRQKRLWACSVANSCAPRTPGPPAPSE